VSWQIASPLFGEGSSVPRASRGGERDSEDDQVGVGRQLVALVGCMLAVVRSLPFVSDVSLLIDYGVHVVSRRTQRGLGGIDHTVTGGVADMGELVAKGRCMIISSVPSSTLNAVPLDGRVGVDPAPLQNAIDSQWISSGKSELASNQWKLFRIT
jgi:hypothetical protein